MQPTKILVKSKSSSQVPYLLDIFKMKYYIKCSSNFRNSRYFLFFLHKFKQKTEVNID